MRGDEALRIALSETAAEQIIATAADVEEVLTELDRLRLIEAGVKAAVKEWEGMDTYATLSPGAAAACLRSALGTG